MTEEQINMVSATLNLYGAALSEDNQIIGPTGKLTGVMVVAKGKRLRLESVRFGSLLSSGPIAPSTIGNFVERFWYWEKI